MQVQNSTAQAFGVTIEPSAKKESQPALGRQKKGLILLGGLLVIAAPVLWWIYGPAGLDPDAQNNPEIREVLQLEKKKDVQGLTQKLHSTDDAAAVRAVSSLANVGGPQAVSPALEDSRPSVRTTAVSMLGVNPTVADLPVLSQHLHSDPDSGVRLAALRSVSAIKDFSIFDHLIQSLSDPDPSIRRSAIGAIQDRVGLVFRDYDPTGSPEGRARAIGRIKAMVPKMKERFDTANGIR